MQKPTITVESLEECELSARFWAENLGIYSSEIRKKGEQFAMYAAILSAITALGVWPLLTASNHWAAILVVSLVSIGSAVVSFMPKIKNYDKAADSAASLCSRYGTVLHKLTGAQALILSNQNNAQDVAEATIEEFEAIRAEKNQLSPFPVELSERKKEVLERWKQQKSVPRPTLKTAVATASRII